MSTRKRRLLSDWLAENGFSQAGFAAHLGISQGYLSELLSGAKSPSMNTARLIKEATGGEITADDLMETKPASRKT